MKLIENIAFLPGIVLWRTAWTEHLQSLKVNLAFFSKPSTLGAGGQHGQGLKRGQAAGRAGFSRALCREVTR